MVKYDFSGQIFFPRLVVQCSHHSGAFGRVVVMEQFVWGHCPKGNPMDKQHCLEISWNLWDTWLLKVSELSKVSKGLPSLSTVVYLWTKRPRHAKLQFNSLTQPGEVCLLSVSPAQLKELWAPHDEWWQGCWTRCKSTWGRPREGLTLSPGFKNQHI